MLIATSILNNSKVSETNEQRECYNPSHLTELVGRIDLSPNSVVKEAETAAISAQKEWTKQTGAQKSQLLYTMAEALSNHAEDLAELGSKEMGKPITEMKGEVQRAIQLFKYYASEGVHPDGDTIPSSAPNVLQYAKRKPLGVVGVITPWNFPIAIPVWKIAPALICGNSVIWKPAENATLTAFKMMEIFISNGLPEGLINLIVGKGKDVGNELLENTNLNAVSFTGSTGVGQMVAEKCAKRNIKFQTEMGGKNPAVVLNDADVNKSAKAILSGAFRSAGQKCTATSRVIVEEHIMNDFKKALQDEMRNVVVAPAEEGSAYAGPVASEDQYRKVKRYYDLAKEDGKVVAENSIPDENGYFISPLIVEGIGTEHQLWKEEVFGPLIMLVPTKDVQEATELANDTEFGLSASVFTNNLSEAHYFLEHTEAGMVRVNQETAGVEYQAPFGGMKLSSSHTREQGQAALAFYSEMKTYAINHGW
ncbi:aldehyde dehydrogenase family protein [Salsuginibacillus kocurii]|uniref:aldehyde dehydrogenase family protein n=1 Tax=Salsuginibacillus kocurii TaxID=427078 RepID=UPI0003795494|nr:aldehyde dehydrogenase family protein [Salsuginibacillus kocurii]